MTASGLDGPKIDSQLYMYYPCGPSWHAIGPTLPLNYPAYIVSSQLGFMFSNLGPPLKKFIYPLQVLVLTKGTYWYTFRLK